MGKAFGFLKKPFKLLKTAINVFLKPLQMLFSLTKIVKKWTIIIAATSVVGYLLVGAINQYATFGGFVIVAMATENPAVALVKAIGNKVSSIIKYWMSATDDVITAFIEGKTVAEVRAEAEAQAKLEIGESIAHASSFNYWLQQYAAYTFWKRENTIFQEVDPDLAQYAVYDEDGNLNYYNLILQTEYTAEGESTYYTYHGNGQWELETKTVISTISAPVNITGDLGTFSDLCSTIGEDEEGYTKNNITCNYEYKFYDTDGNEMEIGEIYELLCKLATAATPDSVNDTDTIHSFVRLYLKTLLSYSDYDLDMSYEITPNGETVTWTVESEILNAKSAKDENATEEIQFEAPAYDMTIDFTINIKNLSFDNIVSILDSHITNTDIASYPNIVTAYAEAGRNYEGLNSLVASDWETFDEYFDEMINLPTSDVKASNDNNTPITFS